MRLEQALCVLVLAGLAGGCTSSDDSGPRIEQPGKAPAVIGSPPPWTEPASYTFVLTRGCHPNAPLGRYRASVRGGSVTGYQRIGASAGSPRPSAEVDLGPVAGQPGEDIEVPSLSELVEMAQTATDDGGQVTREFDAADGHPVKVTINVSDTPGEDECFAVSEYQPQA